MDDPYVLFSGAELIEQRTRTIGRTVIDEDDFALEIALLREQRFGHARQIGRLVVNRDDEGNPGGHRRGSSAGMAANASSVEVPSL